jgi:hypothetical protein
MPLPCRSVTSRFSYIAAAADEGFTLRVVFGSNPYFSNEDLQTIVQLPNDGPASVRGTKVEWKEAHSLEEFGGEDSFFALFDEAVDGDLRLDLCLDAHSAFKALNEDPLAVMQEDMDDEDDDEDDEDDDDEDDEDDDEDEDDDDEEEEEEEDDDDGESKGGQ